MNEAAPSNWSTPRFTDRDVVFLEGREYKIEPEKDSPNDDGTINVKVFCNNNTFFLERLTKKYLLEVLI